MGNALGAGVARRSGPVLCAVLFVLAVLAIASPSGALPELEPVPVPPSQSGGGFESAWVAPFVQYSWANVSGKMTYCVRWYSESGTVESETDKLFSLRSPFGFFFTSGPFGQQVFHGVYGDWKFKSPGEKVFVLASPNGRTLIHLVGPDRHGSTSAIVVYVMGRKTSELGPLAGMVVGDVRIGDDGSVAALFSRGDHEPQAFVTDVNGALSMRIGAPGVFAAQPGPNGRGVLLWHSGGGLEYADKQGGRRELSPSIELAERFAHWLPDSMRVLLGNERQQIHVLCDLEERRVVWQTEAPAHLNPLYAVPFGDYVFQSGLQAAPTKEEPEGKVRIVRALDILTGDVVATWVSSPPKRYAGQDIGKLMIRDQRLYFVTDDAFSEISPADVTSGCWFLPKGN